MDEQTRFYSDSQANHIYLSVDLNRKHHSFFTRLTELMKINNLSYCLLPGSRNIWVRDYMPVQVSLERFVRFVYNPDYQKLFQEPKTKLDWLPNWFRKSGACLIPTTIVLDGGNLVRESHMAILTDKIFRENPPFSKSRLLNELGKLLQVDPIVVVLQDPDDIIGHADGMVRFLDANTVIMNDYSHREDKELAASLRKALRKAGLQIVNMPYNPYQNRAALDARGVYINYLRTRDVVIVPVFGLKEDELALRVLEDLFRGTNVQSIESSEIARSGGVLNCISWTIMM